MEKFDIIEYISGMTSYVFDKAMIRRIAVDRGVIGVTAYSSLTVKDRDLIKADLLYEAYLSPRVYRKATAAITATSEVSRRTTNSVRGSIISLCPYTGDMMTRS